MSRRPPLSNPSYLFAYAQENVDSKKEDTQNIYYLLLQEKKKNFLLEKIKKTNQEVEYSLSLNKEPTQNEEESIAETKIRIAPGLVVGVRAELKDISMNKKWRETDAYQAVLNKLKKTFPIGLEVFETKEFEDKFTLNF